VITIANQAAHTLLEAEMLGADMHRIMPDILQATREQPAGSLLADIVGQRYEIAWRAQGTGNQTNVKLIAFTRAA
jgi:hypothetical protein